MKKDKIVIKMDIIGTLKDRLEFLESYHQLGTWTGVIRMLITKEYERLKKEQKRVK